MTNCNDRVRQHGADTQLPDPAKRRVWTDSIRWQSPFTCPTLLYQWPGSWATMLKHRPLTVSEWIDGHHTMSVKTLEFYQCRPSTISYCVPRGPFSDSGLCWSPFTSPVQWSPDNNLDGVKWFSWRGEFPLTRKHVELWGHDNVRTDQHDSDRY